MCGVVCAFLFSKTLLPLLIACATDLTRARVITVRPGADPTGSTEMTRTSTEPADSSAIAVRFGTVIAVQNRNGVETV